MNRRELLGGASAATLAWAFGCGSKQQRATTATKQSGEVRTWLHDAVARLAGSFASVHALAVSRRHTTAAIDVLGSTVAHDQRDGVVLVVTQRDGAIREQVTHDLSQAGLAAAVTALAAETKPAALDVPPPQRAVAIGAPGDAELLERVAQIARFGVTDSRIVYAAALVDLDDATVWSIAPDHDREQRLVRIRERVVRAAWHGAQPSIGEAGRAWRGSLADQALAGSDVETATRRALEVMTPGLFEDQRRAVLVDPSVAALLVDAAGRALPQLPEAFGSPVIALADDPTVPHAYGGFVFDDTGEPAQRIALVEGGRRAGALGRGRARRAGHVGALEVLPPHLVLAPGAASHAALRDATFVLEGGTTASVDAASGWVVVGATRARELQAGRET